MHVWTRTRWGEEAEAALGPLIVGDRENVLSKIASGTAQLFSVDGPDYGGWFLIQFLGELPELECNCMAFNGRNTAAGLGELAKLVKQAGAVSLTCSTEQEAVARLYRRQGWQVTDYFLRFQL